MATKINIDNFLGSTSEVPQVAPSHQSRQNGQGRGHNSLANRDFAKLEDGDIRGAVRLTASQKTLAPNNSDTIESIRGFHPPRYNPDCNLPAPICYTAAAAANLQSVRRRQVEGAPSTNNNGCRKNGHKWCPVLHQTFLLRLPKRTLGLRPAPNPRECELGAEFKGMPFKNALPSQVL